MGDKTGVGTFIVDESEITTHSLDIFSVPSVDSVIKKSKSVYIHPANSVTDTGPFEFIIPRDPDSYYFLPLTRLEGEIQVVKQDGTALAENDNVSIVNLFSQSLFKQVECEINGTQVCDLSTPTYAFKAFIETHLTYKKSVKETNLRCSYYSKETLGKEESTDFDDQNNKAAKERVKYITAKKILQFSNLIHSDFFQCHKYLIPNTELKVKFIRNPDSFSLFSKTAGTAKIIFKNLKLRMMKIYVDPNFQLGQENRLRNEPALYPLTQSKIKTFLIPVGTTSTEIPNIIQGNMPRSIIIGFLSSDSFNGVETNNPFAFQNFGINFFNLKINGMPVCANPFQPDFTNDQYMQEYRWFLDNCGIQHDNESNGITYEDFKTNSNFWCFDLTPDMCNSFHLHETKGGTMDLTLGFNTALTKAIHMIAYASFNSVIAIDHERNVRLIE